MTLPTALAAPVELGMMFCEAPRPPLQSLPLGPSTVFWVAVAACTVVIRPSRIPKLSLITLARGARQLVVQEALDTIFMSLWWAPAFSRVVNTPVLSTTYTAPTLPQGMAVGSRSENTVMERPSTTSLPSAAETSPLYWPWVESYLNM